MRLSPCPLLIAACLAGATARAQEDEEDRGPVPVDELCREERATCREDCTLDFGTQEATREKVPRCLANCDQAEIVCLARYVAKRHAGKAASRTRYAPPAEDPEASPEEENLPPVRKRTATRAADLKPAPNRNPEAYPESASSRPLPGEAEGPPPEKQPVERLDPPPPKQAPAEVLTPEEARRLEAEDRAPKAKDRKKRRR